MGQVQQPRRPGCLSTQSSLKVTSSPPSADATTSLYVDAIILAGGGEAAAQEGQGTGFPEGRGGMGEAAGAAEQGENPHTHAQASGHATAGRHHHAQPAAGPAWGKWLGEVLAVRGRVGEIRSCCGAVFELPRKHHAQPVAGPAAWGTHCWVCLRPVKCWGCSQYGLFAGLRALGIWLQIRVRV